MQNDTQFVVNIVPLANIQTNASGLDPTAVLSNQVANILTMVDTDQKRINTDTLASFTANGAISVVSPLNLSNVGILSNGITTASLGGGTSSITAGSTIINLVDTISTTSASFQLSVKGALPFQILGASTTSLSTVLEVGGAGVFAGTVSATGFVTLSDIMKKQNVHPVSFEVSRSLGGIRPYFYRLAPAAGAGGSGDPQTEQEIEIGLLAQELEKVFPESVRKSQNGTRYVNYNSVVALLLGAVRELNERVDRLERRS